MLKIVGSLQSPTPSLYLFCISSGWNTPTLFRRDLHSALIILKHFLLSFFSSECWKVIPSKGQSQNIYYSGPLNVSPCNLGCRIMQVHCTANTLISAGMIQNVSTRYKTVDISTLISRLQKETIKLASVSQLSTLWVGSHSMPYFSVKCVIVSISRPFALCYVISLACKPLISCSHMQARCCNPNVPLSLQRECKLILQPGSDIRTLGWHT